MVKIMNLIIKAFRAFDFPLLLILLCFFGMGMMIMHSAVGGVEGRFARQLQNFVLAFAVMWVVAMIPVPKMMKLVTYLYGIGILMLVAVLLVGITNKGATRWLGTGSLSIQPSEFMKLVVPMMLAWYFDKRRKELRTLDFIVAGALLGIPALLIMKQPDLGTALLVIFSGFGVLYFAGMSFKLLTPAFIALVVFLVLIISYQTTLCAPDFDWVILHDYQKHRVCTLLDPSTDPLGKGFHTIQGMIAIGSGGIYGKGYMMGTQSHLNFIPESTTDFIFAVYAEELGLYGAIVLLLLYTLLIGRGFFIALKAKTLYGRLLAGALTIMFFAYVFVNMGMVMGILPIVGVPLPFMSYGGTALITLGIASGMLMSIANYKPHKKDDEHIIGATGPGPAARYKRRLRH
ncbi:rod shape-determining protein RodA [Brackiella oedipodis]|uniref:rod shape-determining protein RodA n=1 Tax=Brackiella oedipodis TaxID=124225 RepID=UPI000A03623B|nr:rod shape-determining protein RodA [Brackiella oedipodis]